MNFYMDVHGCSPDFHRCSMDFHRQVLEKASASAAPSVMVEEMVTGRP